MRHLFLILLNFPLMANDCNTPTRPPRFDISSKDRDTVFNNLATNLDYYVKKYYRNAYDGWLNRVFKRGEDQQVTINTENCPRSLVLYANELKRALDRTNRYCSDGVTREHQTLSPLNTNPLNHIYSLVRKTISATYRDKINGHNFKTHVLITMGKLWSSYRRIPIKKKGQLWRLVIQTLKKGPLPHLRFF